MCAASASRGQGNSKFNLRKDVSMKSVKKTKILQVWIWTCLMTSVNFAFASSTWVGKQVGRISAPDWRNCLYFELVGVPEADASIPGASWFAVDKGQPGYTEIYSMLLWAKATGAAVSVVTTTGPAQGNCSASGNFIGVVNVYTTN